VGRNGQALGPGLRRQHGVGAPARSPHGAGPATRTRGAVGLRPGSGLHPPITDHHEAVRYRDALNALDRDGVAWGPGRPMSELPDGPVARSCAWCGELFVPNVARVVSCSPECRKRHDAERHKRSAEKVRATRVPTSRPCPRCGETQNMSSGECQGWVCVAVRRRESRRRVLA
jgi:hypothetical protein